MSSFRSYQQSSHGYQPDSHRNSREITWPDGSSAGVVQQPEVNQRTFLRDLVSGVCKGIITGLVIAKQDPRSFPDKKNYGQLRYQLGFTIRDSVTDFINVTCWGGEIFILDLAKLFKIGDVVEIKNALVQSIQNPEIELRYKPWTPSAFQVTVNENNGTVQHYSGWDYSEFSAIAYLPVKESHDYYTFGDIMAGGHNLSGSHVNILAAIKSVGTAKDIVTKAGRHMKRRELKLYDETCTSFPLIMWDEELSEIANSWTAHETVLFIADAKVTYDNFRKSMIATCDSKTIVTCNPDTPEAHSLYSYAQSTDCLDEGTADSFVDLSTIQDYYTMENLQDKMEDKSSFSIMSTVFYGITIACITNLDIDTLDVGRALVKRCSACKRRVDHNTGVCVNPTCTSSDPLQLQANNMQTTFQEFDFRVDLSDHTGGIGNFRLQGDVAEKVLGCTVEQFSKMGITRKTELKWKLLFERHEVYFKCQHNEEVTTWQHYKEDITTSKIIYKNQLWKSVLVYRLKLFRPHYNSVWRIFGN